MGIPFACHISHSRALIQFMDTVILWNQQIKLDIEGTDFTAICMQLAHLETTEWNGVRNFPNRKKAAATHTGNAD